MEKTKSTELSLKEKLNRKSVWIEEGEPENWAWYIKEADALKIAESHVSVRPESELAQRLYTREEVEAEREQSFRAGFEEGENNIDEDGCYIDKPETWVRECYAKYNKENPLL